MTALSRRTILSPIVSQDRPELSYGTFRGIWLDTRPTPFRGQPGALQAELFVARFYFPYKTRLNAVEKGQSRGATFGLAALRTDLWRNGARAAEVRFNRWVTP